MIFVSVSYDPDSGTEFIPNTLRLWENGAFFIFIFYCHTIPRLGLFVRLGKLLNQVVKFHKKNAIKIS
jgi:hypothetical protein